MQEVGRVLLIEENNDCSSRKLCMFNNHKIKPLAINALYVACHRQIWLVLVAKARGVICQHTTASITPSLIAFATMNSASSELSSSSLAAMSAKMILLYARLMVRTAVLTTLWCRRMIRLEMKNEEGEEGEERSRPADVSSPHRLCELQAGRQETDSPEKMYR